MPAKRERKSDVGGERSSERAARVSKGSGPTDEGASDGVVAWAVVGQGHFAQTAILPAFAHAKNARLVAIFSDDDEKKDELRRAYGVEHALGYEQFDDFLRSGAVQAVYIALPNHLHCEYTVRAARAGVHVLCEKPMAVDERECREMIAACEASDVRLMVAYRLHFERANMTVVDQVRAGAIGEVRSFVSAFSFPVTEGNVRVMPTDRGGGPVYDIGTYCINAARYVFGAEPVEVVAAAAGRGRDARFQETEEHVSAVLRFPDERLATFHVGFSATSISYYTVLGTKGLLHLEPAFTHSADMVLKQTAEDGDERQTTFKLRDQVAAELDYFGACVLEGREPEPSGWEGLADVQIIRGILEAARSGARVRLSVEPRRARPSGAQVIDPPSPEEPEVTVEVQPPHE
jgi:predicted dehydrogenase